MSLAMGPPVSNGCPTHQLRCIKIDLNLRYFVTLIASCTISKGFLPALVFWVQLHDTIDLGVLFGWIVHGLHLLSALLRLLLFSLVVLFDDYCGKLHKRGSSLYCLSIAMMVTASSAPLSMRTVAITPWGVLVVLSAPCGWSPCSKAGWFRD